MARLRVILDTNIWVSGFAYPASVPGRILQVWRMGGLSVMLSHYILDEIAQVLPRLPRHGLSSADIRNLVDSMVLMAEVVEPTLRAVDAVRDAKDQPILDLLVSTKADYLITGDKDLLALADRYPIITATAFWARHGG
jgi:uncharacterized protein